MLRVLGSTGSHKISGGQLEMVEHAMRGTYYGWAQVYLLVVRHQLNHAREFGGGFCFDSFLFAFFFEKVSTLRPHQAVRDSAPQESQMRRWCERAVEEWATYSPNI